MSSDLTFSPSATGGRECGSFTISDDDIVENEEVFSLELTTRDQAVVFLNARSADVTVTDNDGMLSHKLFINSLHTCSCFKGTSIH